MNAYNDEDNCDDVWKTLAFDNKLQQISTYLTEVKGIQRSLLCQLRNCVFFRRSRRCCCLGNVCKQKNEIKFTLFKYLSCTSVRIIIHQL